MISCNYALMFVLFLITSNIHDYYLVHNEKRREITSKFSSYLQEKKRRAELSASLVELTGVEPVTP